MTHSSLSAISLAMKLFRKWCLGKEREEGEQREGALAWASAAASHIPQGVLCFPSLDLTTFGYREWFSWEL